MRVEIENFSQEDRLSGTEVHIDKFSFEGSVAELEALLNKLLLNNKEEK